MLHSFKTPLKFAVLYYRYEDEGKFEKQFKMWAITYKQILNKVIL